MADATGAKGTAPRAVIHGSAETAALDARQRGLHGDPMNFPPNSMHSGFPPISIPKKGIRRHGWRTRSHTRALYARERGKRGRSPHQNYQLQILPENHGVLPHLRLGSVLPGCCDATRKMRTTPTRWPHAAVAGKRARQMGCAGSNWPVPKTGVGQAMNSVSGPRTKRIGPGRSLSFSFTYSFPFFVFSLF